MYITQRHFIYFVFVWRTIKRSAVSTYEKQPKISKVSLNPKITPISHPKVVTYPKNTPFYISKWGLIAKIEYKNNVFLSQTNSLKCPHYTNNNRTIPKIFQNIKTVYKIETI